MRVPHLESVFPNLRPSGYDAKSPADHRYNCIAWAAHDTLRWFEPDALGIHFWPVDLPRGEYTLENYTQCFARRGYKVCSSARYQAGYEKVALYADAFGLPSHAARMNHLGIWTSKLGELEDIEHSDLRALEGTAYGGVRLILKRRLELSTVERIKAILRIHRIKMRLSSLRH